MFWFKKKKEISYGTLLNNMTIELFVKIHSIDFETEYRDNSVQIEILNHPCLNKPFYNKNLCCINKEVFNKILDMVVNKMVSEVKLSINVDFDKDQKPTFIISNLL